jgi:hypothetical protein
MFYMRSRALRLLTPEAGSPAEDGSSFKARNNEIYINTCGIRLQGCVAGMLCAAIVGCAGFRDGWKARFMPGALPPLIRAGPLEGGVCLTHELGPVNTCFTPTTVTDFSRNKARAARQSKLCKRRVTTGRGKFRPVPAGCARKNAGAALQSLAIGSLCPALRALPSRFFAQQRGRETSVNRP